MDVLFSVTGISMLFLIDFFCSSQIGMANNNIFVFLVQSSEVHIPVQPTLKSTVQKLLNLSKLYESLASYLSLTFTGILPTFHVLQNSNNVLQPLIKLQSHDQVRTE